MGILAGGRPSFGREAWEMGVKGSWSSEAEVEA